MTRARAAVAMLLPALLAGAAPPVVPQHLSVDVEGLRSARGMLRICLTRMSDHFPDCSADPDRRHYSVAATEAADIDIGMLPPGGYALAVIHDENANEKLDTFAGIPREGVGFSENPAIRFGAPSFRSARFAVSDAAVRQRIKMRYFL